MEKKRITMGSVKDINLKMRLFLHDVISSRCGHFGLARWQSQLCRGPRHNRSRLFEMSVSVYETFESLPATIMKKLSFSHRFLPGLFSPSSCFGVLYERIAHPMRTQTSSARKCRHYSYSTYRQYIPTKNIFPKLFAIDDVVVWSYY